MSQLLMKKAANIAQLKTLAKSRIPGFVYDYLTGGCNDDLAVGNNRKALDQVYLQPRYLTPSGSAELSVEMLGRKYNAPFGVAPLGLSGLIWPRASEYQARAAKAADIPFVLSTVASISIEQAAQYAEDCFWYQLYPPTDHEMLSDLLRRADAVGCKNLVVTIDVPSLGKRPRDIRNGLTVPPKLNMRSLSQIITSPAWALSTAWHGAPEFETIKPYLKNARNMAELSDFIRNTLKDVVDRNLLQKIRDQWPHSLIVKGITNCEDAEIALQVGADAVIVSNHGGRQLDASMPPINLVSTIKAAVGSKIPVMADGGVESGVDIARFLAQGADMVFSGRAMMYGVAALGEAGAEHVIELLQEELRQVMEQLRCQSSQAMIDYRVAR
jgi:isopentenyl diphosphate isomerase/L-lactate dehydrogenase-like FMN-dependent dehydrogenase